MMNDNLKNEAVILSAVRTPIGRFLGALSKVHAAQLGAAAIKEAAARAQIKDLAEIDEVLTGAPGQLSRH